MSRPHPVPLVLLALASLLLLVGVLAAPAALPAAAQGLPSVTWRFEYLRQWAHQPPLGTFNIPWGMAFDKAGNLYVIDQANHRVQVLNREGVAIRAFGRLGNGPGELNQPHFLAVDSQGYVYVADRGNDRVVKFAPDGTPVAHFDDFINPWGIAVGSDDTLYVSDSPSFSPERRGRLHRLAPDGSDHRIIRDGLGSLGSLKVKPEVGGDVIYALAGGGIILYNPQGAVLSQWAELDLHIPLDFEIDRAGNLYGADQDGNRVVVRSGRDGSIRVWHGFASPRSIVLGPDNLLYVADGEGGQFGTGYPTAMRIQRFTPAGAVVLPTWGSDEGRAEGQLVNPDIIAWGGTGHVWVHDNNDGRFQRFTTEGDFDLQIPDPPNRRAISFMRTDSKGNLLVSQGCQIRRLTPTGEVLQVYENRIPCALPPEDPNTIFSFPRGFDVDSADNLYVADLLNHRVVKLSSQGDLLRTYGESKTLTTPLGVAVGPTGRVYVLDQLEYLPPDYVNWVITYSRIQVFSPDGALEATWRLPRVAPRPPVVDATLGHIEVDSAGYVYVADIEAATIRKLEPVSGAVVASIEPGSTGAGPGQFDRLVWLGTFAVAPNGDVYTVEGMPNGRVQVFGQTAASATPTATATATASAVATDTPTPSTTPTPTTSPTASATVTPTFTPILAEPTSTATSTGTTAPTETATSTPEPNARLYLPYLAAGR